MGVCGSLALNNAALSFSYLVSAAYRAARRKNRADTVLKRHGRVYAVVK
jgi:hypothetical protein